MKQILHILLISTLVTTSISLAIADDFTPLVPLKGDTTCDRCTGYLLPGKIIPSPESIYRIDSDLPEIFLSPGVLYSTAATLPPFITKDGTAVPAAQRTQHNTGFTTIDDSFEVFLYHMSNPAPGADARKSPTSRRVAVYARNTGAVPVSIAPRQIIEADGQMAKVDGPETRLSRRVFADQWERVMRDVTIPPGEGRVIGWTPRLSVPRANGAPAEADTTASDFVTGSLRATVTSLGTKDNPSPPKPSIEVSVIGVNSDVPLDKLDTACESLRTTGAHSGEGGMDLLIPPPECHVRRVVGVFTNFIWQSDPIVINAATLTDSGIAFQMAAPRVQTPSCPQARQTQDMLLYPGYVHPDTVGNYMVEYLITLTLANTSESSRSVDLRFGKQDADVGIAWQHIVADAPADRDALKKLPVRAEWAGGWRKDDLSDNSRSFFADPKVVPAAAAPITLAPGERKTISLRLMPIGTSSLPFQLHVIPSK
jgi:hypothetical protein